MTYEPFQVEYTAGQPYVGATLTMFPAPGSHGGMGNFIAWDASAGKIVWSKPERFSVWSGALTTAGDVVFYGTLEGYLKAVSPKDGQELWKFKTPSGIIGNVFTYRTAASSTWACTPASAAGPASAWRRASRNPLRAWAQSVAIRIWRSTQRWAARCSYSHCRRAAARRRR